MDNNFCSDEIYEILEDEIVKLKLKPGSSLSENELCARFGVSRTPIRSILQKLEINGFVSITPYKGTTVTLLDFDVINQMIYQRAALETKVVHDFMKICTPMLIERIRYLIRSSRVLIQGEFDIQDFYILDSRLHSVWFGEMKKMHLWNLIQGAHCNYSRFRMLDIVEVHNFEEIVDEHEALLNILIRKDYDAVEPWFEKHLYGGITRLGELVYTDLKDYFSISDGNSTK